MTAAKRLRAMFRLGASLVLALSVLPVQASGTKKVGNWVVITNDRQGGRKDVAAVLSDREAQVGLAIRCIEANLSIAFLPLNNDGLFGKAGRAAASFVQADGQPAVELAGSVGVDRAVQVSRPAPLLGLILSAAEIGVLVPAQGGGAVSASFDLASGRSALAELVGQCPAD
ncbi:hypothetical protein [Bosea sp. BIWAKO-01]|uniref:hypothetical protein n=1 Tax=Bosea sp. BIWAKO-01 TaxID=506668 RepID=UPI00086C8BA4|nr:hypothetical protein [Bosea sp. BIWAKO-01]GAU80592.1 hypothetical protein BIWAKO_00481 [Bosea sp. BIWAKO-01]